MSLGATTPVLMGAFVDGEAVGWGDGVTLGGGEAVFGGDVVVPGGGETVLGGGEAVFGEDVSPPTGCTKSADTYPSIVIHRTLYQPFNCSNWVSRAPKGRVARSLADVLGEARRFSVEAVTVNSMPEAGGTVAPGVGEGEGTSEGTPEGIFEGIGVSPPPSANNRKEVDTKPFRPWYLIAHQSAA